MEGSFGSFESHEQQHGSASPFWEVQRGRTEPIVLDMNKHCQVSGGSRISSPSLPQGLRAVDATLRCLSEDQQRAALASSYGGGFAAPRRGSRWGDASAPNFTVAEMSGRRRDAIKAAFRRIDPGMRGWVLLQDMTAGLQRMSSLSPEEQSQLVHGICSGQGAAASSGRINFTAFAAYYQHAGSVIEKDREFEDLLRFHWGFSEVSDILDDMKNKFAMVGLAYAFKDSLTSAGNMELSVGGFQDAIGRVGIEYGRSDIQRLFDSFDAGHSLAILRFIQHLTSASKPPTPISSLNAGPTFLPEAGQLHTPDLGSHSAPPVFGDTPLQAPLGGAGIPVGVGCLGASPGSAAGLHRPAAASPSPSPFAHSEPLPVAALHQHAAFGGGVGSGFGGGGGAAPGGRLARPEEDLPGPPPAPAHVDDEAHRFHTNEAHARRERHSALPDCETPPAEDHDEMPYAPPEGLEDPVFAPEEEHNEAPTAPPEMHTRDLSWHDEMASPPVEASPGPAMSSSAPAPSASPAPSAPSGGGYRPAAASPAPGRVSGGGGGGLLAKKGSGRRRAVTVGINYIGSQFALNGCINDSDTFIALLMEEFGYEVADIRQLRDDHPQRTPTRKNIIAALKWLVNGARAGDHLFFHYSGHGTQTEDLDGDELDGKDEALAPCDFQKSGMISDDELRRILVQDLPSGCRLTVILDCCHSGTALDLPYKISVGDGDFIDVKKKPAHKQPRPAAGDVVLLSGCMDTQTSADAGVGLAGNTKSAGAMTTAFKACISKKPTASYHDLLDSVRKFLKKNRFEQIPQLSSEHCLKLSDCFMPEARLPDNSGPSPSPSRPPARKALTIGCNYLSLPEGKGQLSGCINDSDTMISILKDTFMFVDSQICRLRDDRPHAMPTKANMLASLRWLTEGAVEGDELFFHFSGHGSQVDDKDGDEASGKDQCLIPCDFQSHGVITDDELFEHIVEPLPKGVNMWVMLDCCHSGSALDLPYTVQMGKDGSTFRMTKSKMRRGAPPESKAEVIMISGCKDDQTSADVQAGSMGSSRAAGAMTTAFRHCVNRKIAVSDLLTKMRDWLKKNGYEQVPQMSSEQFVQLDAPFVTYAALPKDKRVEKAPLSPQPQPMSPMMMAAAPHQNPISPIMSHHQAMHAVSPHYHPGHPAHHQAAPYPMGGHMNQFGQMGGDMYGDAHSEHLQAQINHLRMNSQSPLRGGHGHHLPMQSAHMHPAYQHGHGVY